MNRLLLILILAATPSFCSSAPDGELAAAPQIFAGNMQVIAEPEAWVETVNPGMNAVDASLIDTPPEIAVGNTMMFSQSPMAPSAVFAAAAMLVLVSVAGAFFAGVRV